MGRRKGSSASHRLLLREVGDRVGEGKNEAGGEGKNEAGGLSYSQEEEEEKESLRLDGARGGDRASAGEAGTWDG